MHKVGSSLSGNDCKTFRKKLESFKEYYMRKIKNNNRRRKSRNYLNKSKSMRTKKKKKIPPKLIDSIKPKLMFTEKVYEVLHLLEWQSEVVIKSRKQGDKNAQNASNYKYQIYYKKM